ncbi:ATP-binding cassette domain-containing protein [Actinomyces culturomici]|uniref:ATP-binding cassette domain-containing protein n=1 Tax=Actinomyces culturomici TaxID=1926276 RepID=UPI000E1FF180|nr:ABC transporter ATP-binding protein [Actinomyces culturomici]
MIRIDSLTHVYPRTKAKALDGVSLDIVPGSITGVIGPNGSGKTTLFKTLSGRLAPTSGTVEIGGTALDAEELAAHAAYSGDEKDLQGVSVRSALLYSRLRPTWQETTFARLAERFSFPLKGSLGRRSQGERSLFATGLALASGAPLTLLDEPFGNLDVPTRLALAEEIIRVSTESEGARTILVSSHLVSELETLIERVAVLDSGRLLTESSVDEMRCSVRALVGDPASIRRILDADPAARILSERPLGRLAEIRVATPSPASLDALDRAGVEIAGLTFQDAFASLIAKEH